MDQYRTRVLAWMTTGTPFTVVEDRINVMDELNDEEKSALWLYAYSLQTHRRQLAESSATFDAIKVGHQYSTVD